MKALTEKLREVPEKRKGQLSFQGKVLECLRKQIRKIRGVW